MALTLSFPNSLRLTWAVTGETSAEIVHLKHRHLLQPDKGDYAEYDRQREYDH